MNIETMIKNDCPPAFFETFSPTDWLWPELRKFEQTVDHILSDDMTSDHV